MALLDFIKKPKKPLVLVVDDECIVLETLAGFLEKLNCDTIKASYGALALELAKSRRPQLILRDIDMPVMSSGI